MSDNPGSSKAAGNAITISLDQQLRAANKVIIALTKTNADLKSSNTEWIEHSSDMKDRLLNSRRHIKLLQDRNKALQKALEEAKMSAGASEQVYKEHIELLKREAESKPGAIKKVLVTYDLVVVREGNT